MLSIKFEMVLFYQIKSKIIQGLIKRNYNVDT